MCVAHGLELKSSAGSSCRVGTTPGGFKMVDQIENIVTTSALNIAYEQSGPSSGIPVVLLHGFPFDVRQFDDVRKILHNKKRRLIAPFLRGYGATTYRTPAVFRSGQQAALGSDVIELLDALNIEKAILAGFDWGARAACVAAALWPERVAGLISVCGYRIQNIAKCTEPELAQQEKAYWYQWYFQTERGENGLSANRNDLCKLMWKSWSPTWSFSDELFEQTARSFQNPDFVSTVIQSYRHRHGNAQGDPTVEHLEKRLASQPKISCPTIALHGESDACEAPETSEGQEKFFTGIYKRRVVKGGHCLPAEAPEELSAAIEEICDGRELL
jgi:pimeloyl-ACP methyl ester carboxylesterase